MEKLLLDITVKIRNHNKEMTTTEVKDIDGTFVVKLLGLNVENNIFIQNYLWMKMIIILMKNWMISIIRERSVSYIILVGKTVISLMMMSIGLFIYVVCLSILNFMIKS